MAKVDIWMPVYIGSYLADTMHLTTEQHGAYFLLLLHGWRNGGIIPGDDESLAVISRLPMESWMRNRPVISRFFETGDIWKQKRQLDELEKAGSRRESAKQNGFKGGRPKHNPQITPRLSEGKPTGNPNHNPQKSSSPSPSSSQLESKSARAGEVNQKTMDRALIVLNAYPSKAKKDGRPVAKSLADQNLLAYKIAGSPDHPWEEHAGLMQANPTPPDLRKWVDSMPDPVALQALRSATTSQTETRRYM